MARSTERNLSKSPTKSNNLESFNISSALFFAIFSVFGRPEIFPPIGGTSFHNFPSYSFGGFCLQRFKLGILASFVPFAQKPQFRFFVASPRIFPKQKDLVKQIGVFRHYGFL